MTILVCLPDTVECTRSEYASLLGPAWQAVEPNRICAANGFAVLKVKPGVFDTEYYATAGPIAGGRSIHKW